MRKNKTISFNEADPYELALIKHAEKINPLSKKPRNFSKYVKRLIEEDMKREHNSGNSNIGGFIVIDHSNDEDEDYTLDVKMQ